MILSYVIVKLSYRRFYKNNFQDIASVKNRKLSNNVREMDDTKGISIRITKRLHHSFIHKGQAKLGNWFNLVFMLDNENRLSGLTF